MRPPSCADRRRPSSRPAPCCRRSARPRSRATRSSIPPRTHRGTRRRRAAPGRAAARRRPIRSRSTGSRACRRTRRDLAASPGAARCRTARCRPGCRRSAPPGSPGCGTGPHLLLDRAVPALDMGEIRRIVRAVRDRKLLQPVGETAVARFAMRPRADPQHDLQARPIRELDESAHVAVPVPSDLALDVLVRVPDQVGREHRDAAGAHLAQFALPPLGPVAAEMVFAHDGDPRPPVDRHVSGRDADRVDGVSCVAHLERRRSDRGRHGRTDDVLNW